MVRSVFSPTQVLLQSTVETATSIVTQFLGLAVLAGTLAAVTALAYRWFARERVSRALALVVGLAGVAVYLNTSAALGGTLLANVTPTEEALLNMVTFLFGAGGALAGRRAGDRFGTDVILQQVERDVDEDASTLVRTVGRVTIVELPEEIADVVGYDPVPTVTKETLAGKRFVFPRDLTVSALHDRLVSRIKEDYAVGHVDLELAADGSVDHLALGSRAAGIGPTLPPATNAVAVRADPAFSANAGDLVQVWETDPMRRVLTGELRGVAGDVVTIAIDASDTPKVDPTREYRLVTLPVDDRPEREFASLLRAAPETFSSVTVEAGSPLHGLPVGALDTTVVAVKPEEAESEPLPGPSTLLAPGDTVFAIAPPEALRRLETASEPLDPSLVRDVGRPSVGATDEPAETADAPSADDSMAGAGDVEADAATDSPLADDDAAAGDDAVGGEITASGDDALASADEGGLGDEEVGVADADVAEADGSVVDTDENVAEAGPSDDGDDGMTAGTSSFDDLKEEFESGEADWDEDEFDGTTEGDDSAPATAGTEADDSTDSGGSASSFDELKEEFESGEADWGEESAGDTTGDDAAADDLDDLDFSDETSEATANDIDGLDLDESNASAESDAEEAFEDDGLDDLPIGDDGDDDITMEDNEDDLGSGESGGETDDLSELTFDEEDEADDLSELTFDEEDDDDLFGDDDSLDDVDVKEGDETDTDEDVGVNDADEDDDDEDDDDEDDDDEDEDGGGGGGTSFQQLKEEFESGDADWEDEISDSPGGDMRLDE